MMSDAKTAADFNRPRLESRLMPALQNVLIFFKKIERKYYYIGLFLALAALFIAFSFIFYKRYSAVQTLNDHSTHQYDIIRQHRVIFIDLLDMETGMRGYLLTGDEGFLQPYQKANMKLDGDIQILGGMIDKNPEDRRKLKAWREKVATFREYVEAGINFRTNHPKSIISVAYYQKQRDMMDDLRLYLQSSIIDVSKDLTAGKTVTPFKKQDLIVTILLGNVLIIGLMLFVATAIYKLESDFDKSRTQITQTEALHRAIMEGINDGVFEYNLASESLYLSATYIALLGYDPQAFDSSLENINRLIHPDDLELAHSELRRYIEGQIPLYSNQFRMLHADGRYRWILSRGIGVRDVHGEIKTLIGSHTDITEQKLREEQLKQLNTDLETFTYITSHDLRSPLVNLKGFSRELDLTLKEVREIVTRNALQLSPEDTGILERAFDQDIPEALNYIGYSVERMDTLTKAILDLSRIGNYEYRFEAVDTAQIVAKCLGAQGFQITENRISVDCGPLPEVISDPLALEQIFGNLIDNAIKYMVPERPGHITIRCVDAPSDRIFSVSDNGRGIHPSDQKKIFEIFRRARNTGNVQGQGLGMAYVKATLRKLGGTIWFVSNLDEGSVFYFRIPKTPPRSERIAAALKDTPPEKPNRV